MCKEQIIPVVLCGNDTGSEKISCVRCDNFRGGYLATEYLLKTGRRRIACIRALAYRHGANRLKGYRQALEDYGLQMEEELTVTCPETPEEIRKTSLKLIREQKADAFFCLYDSIALVTLSAVYSEGLKVPEDVAVIGYDDTDIAPILPVPLSSVDSGARQMGEEAVRLLVDIIKNPAGEPRKILLQPELKIRATSGSGMM